jgi:hypothetical protein
MNPFRFGVSVRYAQSRAEWMEKARKVEAFGYATLTPVLISAGIGATRSVR